MDSSIVLCIGLLETCFSDWTHIKSYFTAAIAAGTAMKLERDIFPPNPPPEKQKTNTINTMHTSTYNKNTHSNFEEKNKLNYLDGNQLINWL